MNKLTRDTGSLILKCECDYENHNVEFTLEDWVSSSLISRSLKLVIRITLNPFPGFFRRLRIAYRYLFKKEYSGQYDLVVISDSADIEALERLISRYKAIMKLRSSRGGKGYVKGTD